MMENNKGIRIWCVGGEDVRFRVPFLKELREMGFQVGAVGSESGEAFAREEIEYHRYPLARDFRPWADLESLRSLMSLFSEHRVDILHAFDTKPGMLVPMAAFLTGSHAVCRTVTGMGQLFSSSTLFTGMLKPVYCLLQGLVSRLCQMTIFQNTDDFAYFEKYRLTERRKLKLIQSSGIDLAEFQTARVPLAKLASLHEELGIGKGVVFILVARLVRDKGIGEYLEASRQVRRKHRDTTCLLVGPRGSEGGHAISDELLRRYADDVVYLGRRNDIRELLSIADAFVLPTYYREGVPRVLLEAGAMGLPMVTTDMPGCRDVVVHGWNGLLVPPRDPMTLADAMEWLIAHREHVHLIGARGKSHIEAHFDLKLVTQAYADLYMELVGGKSHRLATPQAVGLTRPVAISSGIGGETAILSSSI
jgi:glycosyltransferase involved in cell wall biosynthesis